MTSTSMRLTGARKLNAVKTLAGHESYFVDGQDGKQTEARWGPAISYFTDGQKMISGYGNTARIWNLKAGEEMEKARLVCEQDIYRVAVSRDNRWVVVAGDEGELKACEVNTGVIKSFQGHSLWILTVDLSRDSKLLISRSLDGTMRIWDLEIGNLVASTTSTYPYAICAVRFSQDSKKLAVVSANNFEVWNIKACKLEIGVWKNYHTDVIAGGWAPVLWTTNDRTIVAACSLDSRDRDAKTIYEIDSSTLEVVGVPFQGHTSYIHSLELSFDCALLVSASYDTTIKLWAFESRHLLASFDVHDVYAIALSPDARQLAYTSRKPGRRRIYICDIPPDIVAELWPDQVASGGSNVRENGDPLNSDATARRSAAAQRILAPVPVVTQPLGRSLATRQQDFFVLPYFHKLFSHKVEIPSIADEPCDPLDCPATSHRLSSKSSSVPTTNLIDHNLGANSGFSQSSNRASSSISRLRHLSNWRPARTADALSPIIDVPLTQGQKRNAAAGAPRRDDGGYVRDEDFDFRPTSPNSTSQRALSGEHGGDRLCFCL